MDVLLNEQRRSCGHEVSEEATACPECGCPKPGADAFTLGADGCIQAGCGLICLPFLLVILAVAVFAFFSIALSSC